MHLGFDDALIEDNVFRNIDIPSSCRALFDFGAHGEGHLARTTIRNNRIENIGGVPDIAHVFRIHPVNQGGHTIRDNTLVDVGVPENGDWCLNGSATPSDIRDNTIDGALQDPNPGCP